MTTEQLRQEIISYINNDDANIRRVAILNIITRIILGVGSDQELQVILNEIKSDLGITS